MRDFRKLNVWRKAHQLTLEIYKATNTFLRAEVYGLTSQIRRACASIPANIAEGCGRETVGELTRFCYIASGSASELEYHLLLARDLEFLSLSDYEALASNLSEVRRMLTTYIQSINEK